MPPGVTRDHRRSLAPLRRTLVASLRRDCDSCASCRASVASCGVVAATQPARRVDDRGAGARGSCGPRRRPTPADVGAPAASHRPRVGSAFAGFAAPLTADAAGRGAGAPGRARASSRTGRCAVDPDGRLAETHAGRPAPTGASTASTSAACRSTAATRHAATGARRDRSTCSTPASTSATPSSAAARRQPANFVDAHDRRLRRPRHRRRRDRRLRGARGGAGGAVRVGEGARLQRRGHALVAARGDRLGRAPRAAARRWR